MMSTPLPAGQLNFSSIAILHSLWITEKKATRNRRMIMHFFSPIYVGGIPRLRWWRQHILVHDSYSKKTISSYFSNVVAAFTRGSVDFSSSAILHSVWKIEKEATKNKRKTMHWFPHIFVGIMPRL
uniref:Uncharacterized protein n=1 Tax=Pseudo-nitzschia australis TaxID=44445 RepID=A0A7S4AH10_9STRA